MSKQAAVAAAAAPLMTAHSCTHITPFEPTTCMLVRSLARSPAQVGELRVVVARISATTAANPLPAK